LQRFIFIIVGVFIFVSYDGVFIFVSYDNNCTNYINKKLNF